jgi:hypothetical protein
MSPARLSYQQPTAIEEHHPHGGEGKQQPGVGLTEEHHHDRSGKRNTQ